MTALVLAGCQDGTPTSPTTAPSVSAPAQDSRGAAEQAALDAYRGMWQAYAKAGASADPGEPELARYTDGRALDTLKKGLETAKNQGHVIKGEYGSTPSVLAATPENSPTTISITDCLDTTKFLTYTRSGDLVDDEPGGRRLTRATVTNLGAQGWKVTGLGIQAVGTCG